jgi:hypothetical protein
LWDEHTFPAKYDTNDETFNLEFSEEKKNCVG